MQLPRFATISDFSPTSALRQETMSGLMWRWARSGEHAPHGLGLIMIDPRVSRSMTSRALRIAAANGHQQIVDDILLLSKFDMGAQDSALRLAALNGHVAVINSILAPYFDRFADLASASKDALRFAQDNHLIAVVEALMADPRITQT